MGNRTQEWTVERKNVLQAMIQEREDLVIEKLGGLASDRVLRAIRRDAIDYYVDQWQVSYELVRRYANSRRPLRGKR